MYSQRQKEILAAIAQGLNLPQHSSHIHVNQTPGYVDSPIEVHDFAVALMGAIGATIASIGESRGLGAQQVRIDRRHAGLLFNEIAYFFQSGWQFDISAVHTAVNNFYRTRDGRRIFFNGAYQHLRDGILRYLDCPNEREAIAKSVARFDAQTLEDALSALGLCAAFLRSPEEWRAHPQGRAIGDTPPIELIRQGDAAPVPFTPAAARPLERLRVLDFTHVVAGPTIGKLLAEHGADVIHCRNPYLDHILGFDIDTSFGKKTAYIDLRADADRARALDLVRDCDVFVQGFRWGSLAKRGFAPQELWRINPRLIYVEVNAYGFQGPWAERRGWEQLAQAATGLAAMHSAELGEPALIPAYFNDYGSGCLGALGVLSALLRRAQEGGRWIVRVSLARTAMLGMRFAANAQAPVPISEDDLNHYLVDQDSPLGLLTRVAPAIQLEKTPPYVDRAGSFPGSSTLDIGWGPDAIAAHARPHRPTSIFRRGVAHMRGRQIL
ncbi:CoA transferase [Methylocystis sp.]|uniref:CoA transferase n=1 Tax=Methylocystis sp. TaxID=1911079 RepID=UPI003DA58A11